MNIVLTGFMGTGKSTVGKLIAGKLGWQFFDTDEMIEREVGISVAEIFACKGEPYFRRLETQTVRLIALLDHCVISCGGGVVLDPANIAELERTGVIVCLRATPEKIFNRVRSNTNRPLLKEKDPLAAIKRLLSSREEKYARCRFSVDTDDRPAEEVAAEILHHPDIIAQLKAV
jgi:shikimate kinase